MNVRLSHQEIINACEEWLFNHHGIVVSREQNMPQFAPILTIGNRGDVVPKVSIEFPGIEPREPTETPYRG